MKRSSLLIVIVVLLVSCKDGTKGITNKERETTQDSVVSFQQNKRNNYETTPSVQHNKHQLDHQKNSDKNTNDTSSTKKEKKSTSPIPPPPVDVIEKISKEEKPPKIVRTIHWENNHVIINYSKKVYPDPDVGCSASNEEFSIKIPVSKREEKLVLGTDDLQKSELTYSYSGGMYGESSIGSPTSGTIKIDEISDDKWSIEINIEFPVKVMGDLEQQEKQKRFELSGVFQ